MSLSNKYRIQSLNFGTYVFALLSFAFIIYNISNGNDKLWYDYFKSRNNNYKLSLKPDKSVNKYYKYTHIINEKTNITFKCGYELYLNETYYYIKK
eukprot:151023_1